MIPVLFAMALLQDPVTWVQNFTEGIVLGRAKGKPLLVYFRTEWCGLCDELEEEVFEDPAFQEAVRHAVPVQIDIENDPTTPARYGMKDFPSFALIDPVEGKLIEFHREQRTAEGLAGWLNERAPPHRAWFESIELARKTGKLVAIVHVGTDEDSDRFVEKLRTEPMLEVWPRVVFVTVPLQEGGGPRLVLDKLVILPEEENPAKVILEALPD